MRMPSMPAVLRVTAVVIFVVGALAGYDAGTKQVVTGTVVTDTFDVWLALLSWFCAFAAGTLFIAFARLLELAEQIAEPK